MGDNFGYPILDSIPIARNTNLIKEQTYYYTFKAYSIAKAAAECRIRGDWVQFGVYKGDTARMMIDLLPQDSNLLLFDSFEGLQRDWVGPFTQGYFKTDIPQFDDPRVAVVAGYFSDTAKHYVENRDIAFAHIDCDLYESTLDALYSMGDLRPGTILLFDEYVHRIGGQSVDDEHRALTEWVADTNHKVKYLWRTEWTQVCVEVV